MDPELVRQISTGGFDNLWVVTRIPGVEARLTRLRYASDLNPPPPPPPEPIPEFEPEPVP